MYGKFGSNAEEGIANGGIEWRYDGYNWIKIFT